MIQIADIGAGEGRLIETLRHHKSSSVKKIIAIDLCKEKLQKSIVWNEQHEVYNRNEPLIIDYLCGNIFDAILSVDCVVAVEIIEHIMIDQLPLFAASVFRSAKRVIITTPNVEFNVNFIGRRGFRDSDHKFEWTRDEFKNWCIGQEEKYGYRLIEHTGVGLLEFSQHDVGYASQIAVFERIHDCQEITPGFGNVHLLKCIHILSQSEFIERMDSLHLAVLSFIGDQPIALDDLWQLEPVNRLFNTYFQFRKLLIQSNYLNVSLDNQVSRLATPLDKPSWQLIG